MARLSLSPCPRGSLDNPRRAGRLGPNQARGKTMCRARIYLGRPILLDDLLFRPDSSLINQAYMPKMLHMMNLAGFGMMAWDRASHDPHVPYRYSSPTLPVFDRN